MEYAAGTIGTTVDCAELMRAGEVGDEEASSASAALTIMKEIWGDGAFTARDIVKAMAPETHAWSSTNLEDADKAKAEAIADALGELVGRRLDRPTAGKDIPVNDVVSSNAEKATPSWSGRL